MIVNALQNKSTEFDSLSSDSSCPEIATAIENSNLNRDYYIRAAAGIYATNNSLDDNAFLAGVDIDLSNVKTLTFELIDSENITGANNVMDLIIREITDDYKLGNELISTKYVTGGKSIDVSTFTGKYYIACRTRTYGTKGSDGTFIVKVSLDS